MTRNNHHVVTEFGCVSQKPLNRQTHYIDTEVTPVAFNNLKVFVESDKGAEVLEIRRVNGQEVLKATNFVGLIQTNDGTILEILPKIAGVQEEDKSRDIFLKMLRTIRMPKYRNFDFANLDRSNMPLLDLFIKMFCDEVQQIVKSGIKSDYVLQEENRHFLKGKLLFTDHIKKNSVHQERFFVAFDEYIPDIAENRLIKTTIVYLRKIARLNEVQRLLDQLSFIFADIPLSHNIDHDFSRIRSDRSVAHYKKALVWSDVFLRNRSFTSFKGETIAFALLFPMETVFESYVASVIRKKCIFPVKTQVSEKHLIEKPEKRFQLKPDIVIEYDDGRIILDTKWKLLENFSVDKKGGISQSDLYQMFAYGKKYDVNKLVLIYPRNDSFNEMKRFQYDDDMVLWIFPWDVKKSVETDDNYDKMAKMMLYNGVFDGY